MYGNNRRGVFWTRLVSYMWVSSDNGRWDMTDLQREGLLDAGRAGASCVP